MNGYFNAERGPRLRNDRLLDRYEVQDRARHAVPDAWRWVGWLIRLAENETDPDLREYHLLNAEELVEALVDHGEELREMMDEALGVHGKRERIAKLREIRGRTGPEAEAFAAKAAKLEAELDGAA